MGDAAFSASVAEPMARGAYFLAGGFALGAASVSLWLGMAACLPDLIAVPPDAGFDAHVPANCGNGIIDTEAGEACDPGSGPGAAMNPGCSRCQISCLAPDGGLSLIDRTTNHCYFTFPGLTSQAHGKTECAAKNAEAHLVTFAGQAEVATVAAKVPRRIWVGLDRQLSPDGGLEPYYGSVHPDEPGWAPSSECSGCYAPGITTNAALPVVAGGRADAGPACVTTLNERAGATDCSSHATVVCEREPVGHRSQSCRSNAGDQGYCFDLLATMGSSKHYFYTPSLKTWSFAETYCATETGGHLGAGGNLVSLESGAEREQLLWELSQSGHLPDSFWIGLSAVATDSGPVDWVWQNGKGAGAIATSNPPSVWGDHEPSAGARPKLGAYIQMNAASYDTGLAHDDPTTKLPFVCQWIL